MGIKDPLNNRDRSKSKTRSIIIVIWLLSILLSCPILILAYVDRHNIIVEGKCALHNLHFIIYGSIISFVVPLVIMIVVYCLTVKRLHHVVKNFKLGKDSSCAAKPTGGCGGGGGGSVKEASKPAGFNFKLLATLAINKQKTTNSGDMCNGGGGGGQDTTNEAAKPSNQKKNSFVGLRRSMNSQSSVGSYRINGAISNGVCTGFGSAIPKIEMGSGFRQSTNSNASHRFLECRSLSNFFILTLIKRKLVNTYSTIGTNIFNKVNPR